jgi:hypothetical protein
MAAYSPIAEISQRGLPFSLLTRYSRSVLILMPLALSWAIVIPIHIDDEKLAHPDET